MIKTDSTSSEVKNTTCYMCACRCGIRVHLKKGVVRYIDGNPDHPLNEGVICAKGAAGIMKQYSKARLSSPLLRRHGSDRGKSDFKKISWLEAMDILSKRLEKIRNEDPKKLAFFTGRDQTQALTGLFAQQFGTPNYASHGGLCSVNMAAGMIYTVGSSFWEFGGPDLDRSKLFVMFGTAEDHHSNPMKIAISKLKRSGGRFVSVNPVRSGYSAIADTWIPIKPGSDNALLLSMIRYVIQQEVYDIDYVQQYTNSGYLVYDEKSSSLNGSVAQSLVDGKETPLWFCTKNKKIVPAHTKGCVPSLDGTFILDGKTVRPAFSLLSRQVDAYSFEWASKETGVSVEKIESLIQEIVDVSMNHREKIPVKWTDAWGNNHDYVESCPVSFHAMRGLAAHSNGFQTVRSLSILMSLIGSIDRPGGFRHKSPYPRGIPSDKGLYDPNEVKPNTPLPRTPLFLPSSPKDLFVDDSGEAMRIDKAYSWEHPLSIHGMLHTVIKNATNKDPYAIDTLMIFMANLAWNSSMDTTSVRSMLNEKDELGQFKIPFIVVCDAFSSEMVEYADLVLPDTSYLERYDVMSLLDRPISEFDGPTDSVRLPILPPYESCRPFQDVLIELASKLKLPRFTDENGQAIYEDYRDFIIRYETKPGSGIGMLSGFRGEQGDAVLVGSSNDKQWLNYERNNCFFHYALPENQRYMRNWNLDYLQWAHENGFIESAKPIMIQLYSETLQKFRSSLLQSDAVRQPPKRLRERVFSYFNPLPFYQISLETQYLRQKNIETEYPFYAITQRPMAMYHSWDSQNNWLRQIHSHNFLYVNTASAKQIGLVDGQWIWVESFWGKVRCMCRFSEAVEPNTVWTWNAIGKSSGAWNLSKNSDESQKGFLLNHLISGSLGDTSNSDPITGQAGWYDVRVRLSEAKNSNNTKAIKFSE